MSHPPTGGADLHLHTVFSDGAYTPEELVEAARRAGLAAIAITDHDTLAAVERARRAAARLPEVIAGVEFGTPDQEGPGEETHIVGLFLDPSSDELQSALARFRALRRERVLRVIEKLNRAGLKLDPEEVLDLAGPGSLGRLHVARALVAAGYARSVGSAFRLWLGPGRPGFVPRHRPSVAETIALIHRAGGVAVLAHPGKTGCDGDIGPMVEAGLDAIEAYCPDHTPDQVRRYLEAARRYGLLIAGGSDCHGRAKETITLGRVRLDLDLVEALRARAGGKRP